MSNEIKTTSNLLFKDEPLVVNRLAAKVLGLNEAIVIQQVHYWLEISRKAKTNFHDSRTWTYNTYEKWQSENFDFWSVRTLKRIFKSLFDKEILIKGNYNKFKYDKTLWISINYEKLDSLLDEYNKNIEISTECQLVTMSDCNIVTSWHHGEGQVGTMDDDKMSLPIPETSTETPTEISFTTQSTQNVSVVETNKELIQSKTHLLLSKNQENKVSKWNKDRLTKAIDIFIDEDGLYFSFLEKIYKDDKNFAPKANTKGSNNIQKNNNVLNPNVHNFPGSNNFLKYSPEELEKMLQESQKGKFK